MIAILIAAVILLLLGGAFGVALYWQHRQDAQVQPPPDEPLKGRSAFSLLFSGEAHGAEQARALLLAHLEPIFARHIADRTVEELGATEGDVARITGTFREHPIRLELYPSAALGRVEIGHGAMIGQLTLCEEGDLPAGGSRERVGYGYCLASDEDELRSEVQRWQRLSAVTREQLLARSRAARLSRVELRSDAIWIERGHLLVGILGAGPEPDARDELEAVFAAASITIDAVDELAADGADTPAS